MFSEQLVTCWGGETSCTGLKRAFRNIYHVNSCTINISFAMRCSAQNRALLLVKAPCHWQWNYLSYGVFTQFPNSRAQLHVTVMLTFPLSCPTHVGRAIWKVASLMSWPSLSLAVPVCLFTDSRWCESNDVSLSEITKKKGNWSKRTEASLSEYYWPVQEQWNCFCSLTMILLLRVRQHFLCSQCLGDLGMWFFVILKKIGNNNFLAVIGDKCTTFLSH